MKLITVGCSFTEGQGLELQKLECYSHLLSTMLNLECYNFGLCGASNDYIFRKVFELIESDIITKEDVVIIQWTHYNRKELPLSFADKKWYYYPPNTHYPMSDKKLLDTKRGVQDEYYEINIDKELNKLKNAHTKLITNYTFNFLQDSYQQNTTKNYINSLYAYMEYMGYNHLHFFGWKNCIIDGVSENKPLFLKENFGEFTNTLGNEHPDKTGHEEWAKFLNEKILEFKLINPFEKELNSYAEKLHKLKVEIEEEIPLLFKNRMEKLKIEFENEIDDTHAKIKIEKENELHAELEKIKLKKEIDLQRELNKLTKTFI
jgi:hypothetical protein